MEAIGRRDRGQLLIITAISLAVLLVLMALALNTAVYGEVHAAGADDDLREERNAVRYEDSVRRGVAGLLPLVDNRTSGGYDAFQANLSRAVANWSRVAGRHDGMDSVTANASLVDARFESLIVHDDGTRVFTNQSGEADWTVADGVEEVDHYEKRIDRERLVNTSDCASQDACFELAVDDGAWNLTAHRTNEKVVIRVDASDDAKCETTNTSVTVNLTNGSFAECDGDSFTPVDEAVDAPFAIRYVNGDNADGTYELRAEGRVDEHHYYDADSGESPRIAHSLDGADVAVTYRSSTLIYRTVIRVDRGEADV